MQVCWRANLHLPLSCGRFWSRRSQAGRKAEPGRAQGGRRRRAQTWRMKSPTPAGSTEPGARTSRMPSTPSSPGTPRTSLPRTLARVVLGGFLLFAGTAHLTFARADFQAQVPTWLPLDADFVVLASGVVEVLLGLALIVAWRWRVAVGFTVAAFFVAVFPGNISQYVTGTDAFGLDTDAARLIRLPFQVLLIGLALWSTAAWRDRRLLLTPLRRRDAEHPS